WPLLRARHHAGPRSTSCILERPCEARHRRCGPAERSFLPGAFGRPGRLSGVRQANSGSCLAEQRVIFGGIKADKSWRKTVRRWKCGFCFSCALSRLGGLLDMEATPDLRFSMNRRHSITGEAHMQRARGEVSELDVQRELNSCGWKS